MTTVSCELSKIKQNNKFKSTQVNILNLFPNIYTKLEFNQDSSISFSNKEQKNVLKKSRTEIKTINSEKKKKKKNSKC